MGLEVMRPYFDGMPQNATQRHAWLHMGSRRKCRSYRVEGVQLFAAQLFWTIKKGPAAVRRALLH